MSIVTSTSTETKTFCVNHPQTETLLRCNKCGKPVCMKCVQRTPVGYRCNECVGAQREGYYNATSFDYIAAGLGGIILGVVGGFVMSLIGGFWIIAIFAGPIAGGIIAEAIRAITGKRRGRRIWLVVCVAFVIGSLLGLAGLPLTTAFAVGGFKVIGVIASRAVLNIGFWIYLALAVGTIYARLRI